MITENLFESVLVEPVRQSADTLYIVSGYASATMVFRHFQHLKRLKKCLKLKKNVRIELIVGMAVQDGLSKKDHEGFKYLSSGPYKDLFICRYVAYRPPVHAKTYAWYSASLPKTAFIGSANYSQSAFSASRKEAMIEHDAEQARVYFDLIRQDTVDCSDPQVSNLITIYSEPEYSIRLAEKEIELGDEGHESLTADALERFPHVKTSLLDNKGGLPDRSGLNWGHRSEYNRNRNQAYIRIPMSIARTDFFPPLSEYFTIMTDDDKSLICVRAQSGAKGIQTPKGNDILGKYFRYRLGKPEGSFLEKEDLLRYGRTDIDFYKIDEETYFMDFSV